jgi:hypothetical protein
VTSRTTQESVSKLKIQEKDSTNKKKESAKLEPKNDSFNISRGEGKKGAKEPLYLLRYE